jgi:prepilin signal peptidase PulO-like enzyme (type II secretory pathway)
VPFVPFLALAAMLAMLYGDRIINFYLSNFLQLQ